MGQAKQRGSQEERAKQAREKIEALKPVMIICNNCKNEITDIHAMNTRGMAGTPCTAGPPPVTPS